MFKIHFFLLTDPSVNIKLISVGGKKNQNIKQKDTQRGPLGDHLKDDPASGDKSLLHKCYPTVIVQSCCNPNVKYLKSPTIFVIAM